MNPEDLLTLLAEVAVAYVGFGSIVAALQSRTESWTIEDRYVFRGLVEVAFGALFIAVGPHLIASFGFSGADVWTYASGCCVFGTIALLVFRITHEQRTFGGVPRIIQITAYPPVLFFLGCNAGNLLVWRAAGPYALGAVTIILQASVMFLVLLYRVFPLTNNEKE